MSGDFDIMAVLARMEAAAPAAIAAALEIGAQASAAHVPVDTGELLNSQQIEVGPERGSVSYNVEHAAPVHEHLGNHHPRGGNAKYLENPWLSEAQPMIQAAARVLGRAL